MFIKKPLVVKAFAVNNKQRKVILYNQRIMQDLLSQVTPIAPPISYPASTTGVQFLQNFLSAFLVIAFITGIVVFLFFLISGGIDFITSGGDKANTEKAKNKITNAIVGLFILLSLFAFLDLFVRRIFGVYALSFHVGQLNVGFNPDPNPNPGPGPNPNPNPTPTGFPDGTGCGTDSQCASGHCMGTVDNDHDGFNAAKTTAIGICGAKAADCNDNDADVHPGQTKYFEDPIPGTTNNFDYDCNGSNDKWPELDCQRQTNPVQCQATPLTQAQISSQQGWIYSVPNCGQTLPANQFYTCNAHDTATCSNPHLHYSICNAPCPTGNICGYTHNQACIGWMMYFVPNFQMPVAKMPCR